MIKKFHEYFGVWGWRAVVFDAYLIYILLMLIGGIFLNTFIAKIIFHWLVEK